MEWPHQDSARSYGAERGPVSVAPLAYIARTAGGRLSAAPLSVTARGLRATGFHAPQAAAEPHTGSRIVIGGKGTPAPGSAHDDDVRRRAGARVGAGPCLSAAPADPAVALPPPPPSASFAPPGGLFGCASGARRAEKEAQESAARVERGGMVVRAIVRPPVCEVVAL